MGEGGFGSELNVFERLTCGIEEMDGCETAASATFDELGADFIEAGLEFDLDIGFPAPPVGGSNDRDSIEGNLHVAVFDGEDGPLFGLGTEVGAESSGAWGVLGSFGKIVGGFLAVLIDEQPVLNHGIPGDGEYGDFRAFAGEGSVAGIGKNSR